MKTLESLTAIDLVRKIDQDDIMTSQVALVLLLLAVCLCRLESSSRLESKRKKRHVPELPLVFLWEWGGSSKNSSRHITKESGSWSTMFDHQDEAKKLLRKCNGVTHRLTPLISKADTVLCAERTHGNSMDMNMKMLEEYHSTVKKHLVRGHGNSAGIVIGSKKTKREFGIHVTTIARRGLLIFGTEAINSDYSDYGSGPIQAMFVPIPYLASPVTSIDGDGKKKGGAKRQYMFSFIGTKNVSIWRNQRSMVMDVLQSRKDSIVHVPTGTRSNVTESEFDVYLDSNFCPSPGGDSRSSKRFFDAIVHGCIPVVCDKAFPLPFHSQTPSWTWCSTSTAPPRTLSVAGWIFLVVVSSILEPRPRKLWRQ